MILQPNKKALSKSEGEIVVAVAYLAEAVAAAVFKSGGGLRLILIRGGGLTAACIRISLRLGKMQILGDNVKRLAAHAVSVFV